MQAWTAKFFVNILVVHQNFPGQFKFLAPALAQAGHAVTALVRAARHVTEWNGIKLIPYTLDRGNSSDAHPWTADFESKVIRGDACLQVAIALREQGYSPRIILAHPGWGESLFLKQVWPDAKLKLYCEFFYHTKGHDVDFDPEFSSSDPATACRVVLKNANMLLQFQNADSCLSPTHWQASTFPEHIRDKITVIHEGIDTRLLEPKPTAKFALPSGKILTRDDEVITFVSRSLEPYRGFHIFMRALPKILEERPRAQVVIAGSEGVSYGAHPPGNTTWKSLFCEEVLPQLTPTQHQRVHFCGHTEYAQFISLLQVSRAHVYLTYPFVLSWSLLEAMSVGCCIVASDTAPLQEVIKNEVTGQLVDFFDPRALAVAVIDLLANDGMRTQLGNAAREFAVQNYDLTRVCLPQQTKWALD